MKLEEVTVELPGTDDLVMYTLAMIRPMLVHNVHAYCTIRASVNSSNRVTCDLQLDGYRSQNRIRIAGEV